MWEAESPAPMSATLEIRCPRCGGLLTPDQVRHAHPTADCTFCQMTVLVRRPDPVPEAPPVAMPKGFEITETPAPKPDALVHVGGDPYRDAGQALALRPGLSIRWVEDNFYLRLCLALANVLTVGAFVTMWIVAILEGGFDRIFAGLVATVLAGGFAWFLRAGWSNARWVRADHEGLHWPRLTRTAARRPMLQPASEIAQLYVRDETPTIGKYEEGIAVPCFILYARDHAGRDHMIVQVEDPEQAWWLEARLEQHLGIVNRRIEGEHRREPPLLPEPRDPARTP